MIFVAIGGFWGAIFRFWLSSLLNRASFPFGTFLVNVLGSFLLGLLISGGIKDSWYLLAATGFFGAFTTFSTFLFESRKMNLFKQIFYIAVTCASGLWGAWTALQAL